MNRVWLTGDAVVDLIPDGETHYLKCPGGAPANVAVAISRLGGNSAFFGVVGNDPFGRFMQQTLLREQVNCDALRLDEAHRTSTVVVDLDDKGERSFTFMVKPSADQFMEAADIPGFRAGEWLHVCSIALANEPSRSTTLTAIDQIHQAGGFFSFDPNLRPEVWANPEEQTEVVMSVAARADVVKFSEDELMLLTATDSIEKGLESLKRLQIPLIVVTQGARGALVVTPEKQSLISGKVVNAIDTTGAGDAFVGGMLYHLSRQPEWHHEETITAAVRCGHSCGALATTRKGAMTALPDQASLRQFSQS